MTDNVDLFADVAAALFIKIYAPFPMPIDVEVDTFAEAAIVDGEPVGATPEAFVEASIHWLASAGLVTFEPGQMGARLIERVGLTAKGYLALQSPVTDGGPIGRALRDEPAADRRRALVGLAMAAAR